MTRSTQGKSNFFEDVYEVVRLVPEGRITTYGAIARYLGTAGSARMVGWAMNQAHGLDVPAHRVVNRIGLLTGKHHFEYPDKMAELLAREGIMVEKDRIRDFDKHFWDPAVEIEW